MKRVLFIDRDGTLNIETEDEQIDSFEKLEFLPGVVQKYVSYSEKPGLRTGNGEQPGRVGNRFVS